MQHEEYRGPAHAERRRARARPRECRSTTREVAFPIFGGLEGANSIGALTFGPGGVLWGSLASDGPVWDLVAFLPNKPNQLQMLEPTIDKLDALAFWPVRSGNLLRNPSGERGDDRYWEALDPPTSADITIAGRTFGPISGDWFFAEDKAIDLMPGQFRNFSLVGWQYAGLFRLPRIQSIQFHADFVAGAEVTSGSPELFEIAHSVELRFVDRDLNPLSGFIDRCIDRTGAGCGFTPGEVEFFIGDTFETDEIVEDAFYVQFIVEDFGVAEARPEEGASLRVVQAFDNAFVGVTFAPEPAHGAWAVVAELALMAARRSSIA